jgi:hypothetical protein
MLGTGDLVAIEIRLKVEEMGLWMSGILLRTASLPSKAR